MMILFFIMKNALLSIDRVSKKNPAKFSLSRASSFNSQFKTLSECSFLNSEAIRCSLKKVNCIKKEKKVPNVYRKYIPNVSTIRRSTNQLPTRNLSKSFKDIKDIE